MTRAKPIPDPVLSTGRATFLAFIGNAVRQARIEGDLSQLGLARLTGHSQAYISRIEHGRANVTMLTLWQIASILHRNVTDLIPPCA